jgi:hypothetical protein
MGTLIDEETGTALFTTFGFSMFPRRFFKTSRGHGKLQVMRIRSASIQIQKCQAMVSSTLNPSEKFLQ